MKIVRVIGGLGNQMFQYAFFLALKRKSPIVKIDISSFDQYSLHYGLELESVFHINLDNELASELEINKLKDKSSFFKYRKLLGKLPFINPSKYIKPTHFVQPNYSKFYPNVYLKKEIYLDGYWQSEKYFSEIAEDIRSTFRWTNISKRNIEIAQQMESENSVSVHIRRFDKPRNINELIYRLKAEMITRVPSKNYYLRSMRYISEQTDNPKFYIFTDNIPWVKKNIPINSKHVIVDWNRKRDSHWDMFLMTKCKHNIVSMSSFSWWGAWLNTNPKKIIIAPKKWAVKFIKAVDIIPKEWIRL